MRRFRALRASLALAGVCLFAAANSYAQVSEAWVARYNGPSDSLDVARVVKVDNAGNVYVTGYSIGLTTLTDFATIKYNSAGAQQWAARYNGTGNSFDEANALAIDDSGNVYVTGFTSSSLTPGSEDITTLKYNSTGVLQWASIYNGPGNNEDKAYAIVIDNAHSVYVTGYSKSAVPGSDDITTVKYNSAGGQQWVSAFNGPGNGEDRAYAIVIDNANNPVVTGYSYSAANNYDYVTVKYNQSGTQQWSMLYNGTGNDTDRAYAIVIDNSNNVYVTGSSIGSGTNYDYATIKYNSGGTQQWASRFNGTGNNEDRAYAIVIDNSNNICITGSSRADTFPGSENFATVLYNSSGGQQWVQYYNGTGNSEDIAYSLATDNTGNFYVTGSSRSGLIFGTEDYRTIKYNNSGTQQWSMGYNGPAALEDRAYAIVIDNSNNVYVSGFSIGIGTLKDYTTIKYTQIIGIQPISNEIPSRYKLYQNYPNPFNPSTVIKFDIPSVETIHELSLRIYDILGREITTLVNGELQAGSYAVDFSAAELPSGIYFYKLSAGSFSDFKKLTLVK